MEVRRLRADPNSCRRSRPTSVKFNTVRHYGPSSESTASSFMRSDINTFHIDCLAIYKAIDSSAFIIRVAKKRIISKKESMEIAVE
jgi:hypothetical protein